MPNPVPGSTISQGFGPTNEPLDGPYMGWAHFNKGIDFAAPAGSPVGAAVGGTVVSVGDSGDGWGLSVKIRDASGYTHNYGHLSAINVKVGQTVQAGANLGAVGSTGQSTGAHLSYDVWDQGGKFVNPTPFLSGDASGGANPRYDPETENKLRIATEQAWSAVVSSGGDPDAVTAWMEVSQAYDFYRTHGTLDTSEDQRAESAFTNAIRQGEFQLNQANSAYGRWKDKRDAAKALAEGVITDTQNRNLMNARLAEAGNVMGPVPETKTYFAPTYDAAFEHWKQKLGVGDEPSQDISSYNAPALPQYKTGGNPNAFNPEAKNFTPVPSNFDPSKTTYTNDGFKAMANEKEGKDWWDSALMKWSWMPYAMINGPRLGGEWIKDKFQDSNLGGTVGDIANWYDDGIRFNRKYGPWGDATKKTKNFWSGPVKLLRPIGVGLAKGGHNLEAGVYRVGEKGPEQAVLPDGSIEQIGVGGPEMIGLPQGSSVLPNGVPPEQAFLYAKIKQLMAKEGQNPGKELAGQQERANDPQLQQKVMEAVLKAMGGMAAANPPTTPALAGPGWTKDPWAEWRPLSGMDAQGQPIQQQQQQMPMGGR